MGDSLVSAILKLLNSYYAIGKARRNLKFATCRNNEVPQGADIHVRTSFHFGSCGLVDTE
jgi:hypothetical protein